MSLPPQQHHVWRTSSRSVGNGQCVELAVGTTSTGIRDTKNRGAGELAFTESAFRRFLADIKDC